MGETSNHEGFHPSEQAKTLTPEIGELASARSSVTDILIATATAQDALSSTFTGITSENTETFREKLPTTSPDTIDYTTLNNESYASRTKTGKTTKDWNTAFCEWMNRSEITKNPEMQAVLRSLGIDSPDTTQVEAFRKKYFTNGKTKTEEELSKMNDVDRKKYNTVQFTAFLTDIAKDCTNNRDGKLTEEEFITYKERLEKSKALFGLFGTNRLQGKTINEFAYDFALAHGILSLPNDTKKQVAESVISAKKTENGDELIEAEGEAKWTRAGASWTVGEKAPEDNQDRHVIERNLGGAKQAFFAVYDGHGMRLPTSTNPHDARKLIAGLIHKKPEFHDQGGEKVAELAAERLHQILLEEIKKGIQPEVALQHAFSKVDEEAEALGPDYVNVGSMAITAFIKDNILYIASLGDCQAILLQGKKPVFASKRYTNVGFGNKDSLINATPDIEKFSLENGYSRLILASDGLWDVISNEKAADLIKDIEDPREAARILQQAALKNSGDNITVIVVDLK